MFEVLKVLQQELFRLAIYEWIFHEFSVFLLNKSPCHVVFSVISQQYLLFSFNFSLTILVSFPEDSTNLIISILHWFLLFPNISYHYCWEISFIVTPLRNRLLKAWAKNYQISKTLYQVSIFWLNSWES